MLFYAVVSKRLPATRFKPRLFLLEATTLSTVPESLMYLGNRYTVSLCDVSKNTDSNNGFVTDGISGCFQPQRSAV